MPLLIDKFAATHPTHTWSPWAPRAGRPASELETHCLHEGCPALAHAHRDPWTGEVLVHYSETGVCRHRPAMVCAECGVEIGEEGICTPACVAHKASMERWYLSNGC